MPWPLPAKIPLVSGSTPNLENSICTMEEIERELTHIWKPRKGERMRTAREGDQHRGEFLEICNPENPEGHHISDDFIYPLRLTF